MYNYHNFADSFLLHPCKCVCVCAPVVSAKMNINDFERPLCLLFKCYQSGRQHGHISIYT